jgi:hypothetical protein
VPSPDANLIFAAPEHQPILRQVGLDAQGVFTHPDIVVWRSLPERENCTLDATLDDGSAIRLHIKRYRPQAGRRTPAQIEVAGIEALRACGIPTVPLVGWGRISDGSSFVITRDLAGYRAADKWLAQGADFDRILEPTARLAACLHAAGLHHRDLYLCHFFVDEQDAAAQVRLIDAARVRRLPIWPLRQRWIVKDLAQFWYSTLGLPITDPQRSAWLEHYARERRLTTWKSLRCAIERKAAAIGRHDAKLRRRAPGRNISIPSSEPE